MRMAQLFAAALVSLSAGACVFAALPAAASGAQARREMINAEAEGAGFTWRLEPAAGGTRVLALRKHRAKLVFVSPTACVVENMFDAPAHLSPRLATPFVACAGRKGKTYLVARHSRRAVTITRYSAPADCLDFTACKVVKQAELARWQR